MASAPSHNDTALPSHDQSMQITPGARLERVEFTERRIVMGFDTGDHRMEIASSLYRRARIYRRSQQLFAAQIVAQIGCRVTDVSTSDERAKLCVTFDNSACLLLGEYARSVARKRGRSTSS